jgi:4a-hydroxytetrahydrobiopterin dehydratase
MLTATERSELFTANPEWALDGETLVRTNAFSDFVGAFAFVTRVALLSEKTFHHPDIRINWNKVTVSLTTHSAGGLTSRDLDLAVRIDS